VLSPVRRVGGIIFLFDEDGKRYTHYVDTATDVAYE
jgi:thiamine biosynthesis lipoprotein ApbE